MNNNIIEKLKDISNLLTKEEINNIIEAASQSYLQNQPFISEEEIAEQTLDNFLNELKNLDKDSISKAKKKIIDLIS
ncbi:MAG: hypothetical protein ACK4IX_08835 [Candidatus Sericytochromatia bacterium]